MINIIKKIFRHRHKWETTHTNKWYHPTRQICKCGCVREVETKSPLMSRWSYSDGTKGEWADLGRHK